jgi:hypothetical protein
MANSNGWGDGAANNAIGWGQGANNSISWGKSHSLSSAGATDIVGTTTPEIDANAQAFITAANITDATQQTAINNLVVGLKADGLWTGMTAIYPFVGGTATTHKWNLKDPRDLDVAYRLSFNGGWTHNSNGITGNGTNAYAETFNNSAFSFGAYSRGLANNGSALVGRQQTFFDGNENIEYLTISTLFNALFRSNDTDNSLGSAPYSKFYSAVDLGVSAPNSLKIYRNGVSILPTSDASATPWGKTITFALGAEKLQTYFVGVPDPVRYHFYGNQNIALAYFSTSILNATQNTNLNTRVVAFQTALSRNV